MKMTTWSVTLGQNLILNADIMHKTIRIFFFLSECIYYDVLHICYFDVNFHCPALGNKGGTV